MAWGKRVTEGQESFGMATGGLPSAGRSSRSAAGGGPWTVGNPTVTVWLLCDEGVTVDTKSVRSELPSGSATSSVDSVGRTQGSIPWTPSSAAKKSVPPKFVS